eukprot:12473626-Prorocentrum_lima.AAC.1
MAPDINPSNLAMPPLPQMCTQTRMSTPGASSHVPDRLSFSPAGTTPQCSPGDGHRDWGLGQRPPPFGAGAQNDVDSLK